MIFPEFTENTEKGVVMFFPLAGRTEKELIAELEKTYYCYSAVGAVKRDGRTYIALTVDDENS